VRVLRIIKLAFVRRMVILAKRKGIKELGVVMPHVLNSITASRRQSGKFKNTEYEAQDIVNRIPEIAMYKTRIIATVRQSRKRNGLKV